MGNGDQFVSPLMDYFAVVEILYVNSQQPCTDF